jgi:hypothetical protein
MPAGRAAALPVDDEPDMPELVDVPVPAEPAVLPAEPDGVEPTVLLVLLPDAVPAGAWFFTLLVLTSQH